MQECIMQLPQLPKKLKLLERHKAVYQHEHAKLTCNYHCIETSGKSTEQLKTYQGQDLPIDLPN